MVDYNENFLFRVFQDYTVRELIEEYHFLCDSEARCRNWKADRGSIFTDIVSEGYFLICEEMARRLVEREAGSYRKEKCGEKSAN